MADTKSDKATAARNLADAEAATPEEAPAATETVPGGKYSVGGKLVDANGEPIGKGK